MDPLTLGLLGGLLGGGTQQTANLTNNNTSQQNFTPTNNISLGGGVYANPYGGGVSGNPYAQSSQSASQQPSQGGFGFPSFGAGTGAQASYSNGAAYAAPSAGIGGFISDNIMLIGVGGAALAWYLFKG